MMYEFTLQPTNCLSNIKNGPQTACLWSTLTMVQNAYHFLDNLHASFSCESAHAWGGDINPAQDCHNQ